MSGAAGLATERLPTIARSSLTSSWKITDMRSPALRKAAAAGRTSSVRPGSSRSGTAPHTEPWTPSGVPPDCWRTMCSPTSKSTRDSESRLVNRKKQTWN
jgi:hypothetical protein